MKAKKISIFIISCTCLLAYITFALTVSINIKDKLILGNLPVSIVYRDSCSAKQFDSHMMALKEAQYACLFADQYSKLNNKSIIITFDCMREHIYTDIFPILKKHGAKATVFIQPDKIGTIGQLTRRQIKEMQKSGLIMFGVGANYNTIRQQNIRQTLKEQKHIIENITQSPCRIFTLTDSFNGTSFHVKRYKKKVLKQVERETRGIYSYIYMTDRSKSLNRFIPRLAVKNGCSADTLLSDISDFR